MRVSIIEVRTAGTIDDFPGRVRYHMQAQGITYAMLARRLGYSKPPGFFEWMENTRAITRIEFRAVLAALGVTKREFLAPPIDEQAEAERHRSRLEANLTKNI